MGMRLDARALQPSSHSLHCTYLLAESRRTSTNKRTRCVRRNRIDYYHYSTSRAKELVKLFVSFQFAVRALPISTAFFFLFFVPEENTFIREILEFRWSFTCVHTCVQLSEWIERNAFTVLIRFEICLRLRKCTLFYVLIVATNSAPATHFAIGINQQKVRHQL